MLDAFTEVLIKNAAAKEQEDELTKVMEQLPLKEAAKFASGAYLNKAAYVELDGKDWLQKYEGTPLYERAMELEEECLALEAEDIQQRMEDRKERDTIWDRRDLVRLKKRQLDLDLHKAGLAKGRDDDDDEEEGPTNPEEVTVEAAAKFVHSVIHGFPKAAEYNPKAGHGYAEHAAGQFTPEQRDALDEYNAAVYEVAQANRGSTTGILVGGGLGGAAGGGLGLAAGSQLGSAGGLMGAGVGALGGSYLGGSLGRTIGRRWDDPKRAEAAGQRMVLANNAVAPLIGVPTVKSAAVARARHILQQMQVPAPSFNVKEAAARAQYILKTAQGSQQDPTAASPGGTEAARAELEAQTPPKVAVYHDNIPKIGGEVPGPLKAHVDEKKPEKEQADDEKEDKKVGDILDKADDKKSEEQRGDMLAALNKDKVAHRYVAALE